MTSIRGWGWVVGPHSVPTCPPGPVHTFGTKKLAGSLPHLPAASTRSNHGVILCQAQSGGIAGNAVERDRVQGKWCKASWMLKERGENPKNYFLKVIVLLETNHTKGVKMIVVKPDVSKFWWQSCSITVWSMLVMFQRFVCNLMIILFHLQHPAEAPDCSADLPVPLLINWTPQVHKETGRAACVHFERFESVEMLWNQ